MPYTERQERQAAEDFSLRSKVLHWEAKDLMRPQPPARDVLPMADGHIRPRSGDVVTSDGIASMSPKTIPAFIRKRNYALAIELGPRAYAEFRRTRKSRKPKAPRAAKVLRPTPEPRERQTGVVVLSDHDLMARLGIMPIGNID